jgi:hypothetical protein
MMFRVFNGEHFQPETECWLAVGPICVIVNYPITIFGNFLVNYLQLTETSILNNHF